MLNKYSIGLIVLVSALASLMQVNALICYKAANLTAGIVDVDQDHGTCTPNNFDLCADLIIEGITQEVCPDDAAGCYIYNNKFNSVDFGCGKRDKCIKHKNCCESGDLCNCSDA